MPHFDFLSGKVQNVWEALGRTGDHYVLIGGTALAYRIGHRVSVDIDLCTSRPAEHPNVLRKKWNTPIIGKHKWLRRKPDHYIKFFETEHAPKIDIHGKVPGGCLELPQSAPNGLRIASVTDILKQKLIAMCYREQPRDGEDVAAILASGRANVQQAIAALRNETQLLGIGDSEAESLGRRLADLSHSPWSGFSGLKALVPILLANTVIEPNVVCDQVEGPVEVLPMDRTRRRNEQQRPKSLAK